MVGCSIIGCKSNSDRNIGIVSFHTFPDDPQLRSAWIAATKRTNWVPKNSSRICGRHFNTNLLRKQGRKTILLPNAVPNMNPQIPMSVRDMALNADGQETLEPNEMNLRLSYVNNEQNNKQDVLMCRICFATDDNLQSMKKDKKLDHAYGTLTGLSIQNDYNLPSYLCVECSQQVMQCIYFRDRSLCAHILLLDILRKHGCVTLELAKNVMECQDVNANLTSTHLPIDQYDPKTVDNITQENDEQICLTNDPELVEDIDIKKEVDKVKHISLTNDPELVEDIDIKKEVDIDKHISLTNDPELVEAIDITNELNIDEHISLTNDPNLLKNTDIKEEVDIDEHISVTNDPNLLDNIDIHKEDDVDEHISLTNDTNLLEDQCQYQYQYIKKEVDIDKHIRFTNDPSSSKEDIDIKKEVDSFSQDSPMDVDAVPSSMLHEDIGLCDIKVETEDGYEEKSVNDEDTTSNIMLYTDAYESDVGSDYTPVGQQIPEAKVSDSEVKGLSEKTPEREKLAGKLLVYDKLCCDVCPYKTVSDVKLLRHLKTHDPTKSINNDDDSNDNIYSCMICKKTLSTKWGLVKHLKIHTDEKPFPCNECDKSFKENRDLQNHMRTHSGEKPFVCDLCKKSFSERGNLLRHIRIHAGARPYTCKYCKVSFNQKHHLKRHLTRHC